MCKEFSRVHFYTRYSIDVILISASTSFREKWTRAHFKTRRSESILRIRMYLALIRCRGLDSVARACIVERFDGFCVARECDF